MVIDNKTKVIVSLGQRQTPLGPAIHNVAYDHCGLNVVYLACTVKDTKDCRRAVDGIRGLGFHGATTTMPYKPVVAGLCDELSESAFAIGAVNTIVNNDGTLTGYNTDYSGAIRALQEKTSLAQKRIFVLGAGGAARAIIYGLIQERANVVVFNRSLRNRWKIARDFSLQDHGDLHEIFLKGDYDILVNATSVGFGSDEMPIDPGALQEGTIVMDIVFNPLETTLLGEAAERGCTVIPGSRMLLYQAAEQFRLFTGQEAPLHVMETALEKALRET